MILSKPVTPTNDARHTIERNVYLAHCENISHIIAAAVGQKVKVRQELVDHYLTATNAEAEE